MPETKYKRLTALDYELHLQMISQLHTLEFVTTQHYLMGKVDRAKFAKSVGVLVRRFYKYLEENYEIDCGPGKCLCNGICVECGTLIEGIIKAEIHPKLGELIDELGVPEVNTLLTQKLDSV